MLAKKGSIWRTVEEEQTWSNVVWLIGTLTEVGIDVVGTLAVGVDVDEVFKVGTMIVTASIVLASNGGDTDNGGDWLRSLEVTCVRM